MLSWRSGIYICMFSVLNTLHNYIHVQNLWGSTEPHHPKKQQQKTMDLLMQ